MFADFIGISRGGILRSQDQVKHIQPTVTAPKGRAGFIGADIGIDRTLLVLGKTGAINSSNSCDAEATQQAREEKAGDFGINHRELPIESGVKTSSGKVGEIRGLAA